MSDNYVKQYSKSKYSFYHLINDVYYTTDLHCHDFIEIYIYISGGKYFLLNDKLYNMEKGDVFVVNSLDIHRVVRQDDVCYERYVLEYKPSFVLPFCTPKTDLMHYIHNSSGGTSSKKLSLEHDQLDYLLSLFKNYENIDDSGFGSDVKKELYFMEMLIYLAETFYENHYEKDIRYSNINTTVSSLLTYIGANLTEDLCLDKLASHVNVDKHYLCNIFKKYTGITINNYISTRRIAQAKLLLLQGHSVTETSEQSGFNSLSNFIRTFNRIAGTSPTKYVKQETQM